MTLNKIKNLKNKEGGFTIVELLIVIVIIGILAALVIVAYTGIQNRARETKAQTDAQAVLKKVEAYAADNDGKYPTLAQITAATGVAKLDSSLTPKLQAAAPATATPDKIGFTTCGTTAGVKIVYWKYASSAVSDPLTAGDTSGACS